MRIVAREARAQDGVERSPSRIIFLFGQTKMHYSPVLAEGQEGSVTPLAFPDEAIDIEDILGPAQGASPA
jgi:hypothetical protein